MKKYLILSVLLFQFQVSRSQETSDTSKNWMIGVNFLSLTHIQRNSTDLGYSNHMSFPSGIIVKKGLKSNQLRIGLDYFSTSFEYTSPQYSVVNYEKIHFQEKGDERFIEFRIGLERVYKTSIIKIIPGLDMAYINGRISGKYNGIPLPSKSFSNYTGKYHSYGLLPKLSIGYQINSKLTIEFESNAVLKYQCLSDSRYSGPRYSGCNGSWNTYWNPIRSLMLLWTL